MGNEEEEQKEGEEEQKEGEEDQKQENTDLNIEINEYLNEVQLKMHNEFRTNHMSPPLEYDAGLAAEAFLWSKHMAEIGYLEHSPKSSRVDQGENLAWLVSGDITEID